MKAGYLSPEGKFFTYREYEHLDVAVDICENHLNLDGTPKDEAEPLLLNLGYLIILQDGMLMRYYTNAYHPIFLTKPQLRFIFDNLKNLTGGQTDDFAEILYDQKLLKKIS